MIGFVVGVIFSTFSFLIADKIEPLIYSNFPIGANFLEIFFIYVLPIILGIVLLVIVFKFDDSETLGKKILNLFILIITLIIGFLLVWFAIVALFLGGGLWILGVIVSISLIFLIILILKFIRKIKH